VVRDHREGGPDQALALKRARLPRREPAAAARQAATVGGVACERASRSGTGLHLWYGTLPVGRLRLALPLAALALVTLVPADADAVTLSFQRMPGYDAPGTPSELDRVGVIKVGRKKAGHVLILNPGTSAGATYFVPLAKRIAKRAKNWQVWSVERRENLLEDHSVIDRLKAGPTTPRTVYEYYLGWLEDESVTEHFRLIPDSEVPFGREWGMRVAVEDLRRVVEEASKGERTVAMGGHSLGGTITTAYATWDFAGSAGAEDLAGLVYVDGGSDPTPITAEQANESLAELEGESPWLAFGGIPAPFAGLFNLVGATLAREIPNQPAMLEEFDGLPDDLRPPVPATNEAGYGYAFDTESSPPSLAAAQVHAGRLAPSGDPRGWDRAGELSPVQRLASMLNGSRFLGHDGVAWYHPRRLTIDAGAVAAGNRNSAQSVLDVRATHGDDLGGLPIYAFAARLGGARVLDAARTLASQSRIPEGDLTLVDRKRTYAHLDPLAASPKNALVDGIVPWLIALEPE
jgi:hypothetical protein